MNYYYLVSQLPNISYSEGKTTLPITGEQFKELCSRFLNEKQIQIINNMSLVAPKEKKSTGSTFLDNWYEKENFLRWALAQIRSQKLKKDTIVLPAGCTADILQVARTAVGMSSPLSAEQFLFEYRIKLIDDIKPIDIFSIDSVYAYGMKLLLIERMKKFDIENGKSSYHMIYDTILGENK